MTRPLIPTINLSKDTPEVQADAIRHALSTVGFFIVEDSGMDPRVIQRVFADGKTFFSQPMHEKERYLAGSSGAGYTKLLTQALGEGKRDHKETFSWGKNSAKNPQPIPPPYSDNPDSLAAMNDFYASCHRVSHRLLEMFAMALDLSPEHFRHSHSFGLNTAFSQIHYPALTPADQKLLTDLDIRAGSHRDWGSLTMLFQEPGGAPGLQVYLPSTLSPPASLPDKAFIPPITGYTDNVPGWEWFDAPVPDDPGSFLVNVGLAMELWSSGVYKATMHRVIFPTAPEGVEGGDAEVVGKEEKGGLGGRSSLAYFVQPDDDVPLSPVISGGRIDDSIKAITSGQLFDFKLKESMNRTKPTPSGRRS